VYELELTLTTDTPVLTTPAKITPITIYAPDKWQIAYPKWFAYTDDFFPWPSMRSMASKLGTGAAHLHVLEEREIEIFQSENPLDLRIPRQPRKKTAAGVALFSKRK
jgi:hypothetical protein